MSHNQRSRFVDRNKHRQTQKDATEFVRTVRSRNDSIVMLAYNPLNNTTLNYGTWYKSLQDDMLIKHPNFTLKFLLTVSKPLNYVIVTHVKDKSWQSVLSALETHKNVYKKYDWNAKYLRFDREKGVSCIKDTLATKLDLHLENSASYQHVAIAERKIRVIKERMRCEICNLGYKMNRNFLLYLPRYVGRRLNICTSNIVGVNISPTEMLTGKRVDSKVELKIGFGEYALAYHPVGVSNDMHPRSTGAICIGLSYNAEASAIFYDISKPPKQTPLMVDNFKTAPMPEDVVQYLNELATNKPILNNDEIMKEDENLAQDLAMPEETIDPANYTPTTANAEDEKIELLENPNLVVEDVLIELEVDMFDDEGAVIDDAQIDITNQPLVELRGEGDDDHNTNTADITDDTINMNLENRRITRGVNGITKTKVFHMTSKVEMSRIFHSRSYHISMKKGLQTYGQEAEKSIFLEVEAMEKKKVFTPTNHEHLTSKQKRDAIRSFMFLKEKFKPDGEFDKLKSRLTANGKTQNRVEVEKSFGRTSSPTVSMTSLMTLLAIAKNENRHIAVVDVKNAYLNADLEKQGIIILLDSVVTKEYLKIRKDAANFVNHKGELYCKLNRALYGTIEAAKAWYDNISSFLERIGFVKNKIDTCVFNKDIKGIQFTVAVYVDDLLITCVDKKLIMDFKIALEREYEEINFNDDVKLPYLGMILDNSNDKYIEVSMPSFIQQIIEDSKIDKDAKSITPCASKLFEVIDDDEKLDDDERENFHTLVAKLLYLSKHSRPDILLATTFLCTRVQSPGKDDHKKLMRLVKYLNGTKDMGLRIHSDGDVLDICVYCDASFAVHPNMRSHSGATITIGGTHVFCKSTKQKLNTKSSTESELVAISDVLPQAIHTADFLQEQLKQQVIPKLYQDNMSTIAMVQNGRASNESTRHINIRYFFISDYVQQGLVDIEHLGTKEMIADYYTKPLQGADFTRHRDRIMGLRDA